MPFWKKDGRSLMTARAKAAKKRDRKGSQQDCGHSSRIMEKTE